MRRHPQRKKDVESTQTISHPARNALEQPVQSTFAQNPREGGTWIL